MASKEELKLVPSEVLAKAREEASRLEAELAKLAAQKEMAETSDFGNPLLADRMRAQILPGIHRDLNAAADRLRRIRDHFIPRVEKELAHNPAKKMSLCDSQCYGETQHCVYCVWD